MKLTDTLDQILRLLVVTDQSSAEQEQPQAALNHTPRPSLTAELEARAVVQASPRPEPLEPQPPVPTAELSRLETAADVAEQLGLGFHLGSAVERIAIAAGEGSKGEPKLHEATWLIDRYLELIERRPAGADGRTAMSKLAREGDAIAGLQAIATALGEPPAAPATEPARFSTLAPPELEEARPEAPPSVVVQQPSFRREVALTATRALIVIVAAVALILALTLIAPLWK